ncbi:MAG TPA: hypothetical protein VGA11_02255 [Acidimicrobiia bacterium]
MTRRLASPLMGVLFVALTMAACSGGGDQTGLSAAAQRRLMPSVETVRRAAESHDPDGAVRALGEVRRTVVTLEQRGTIDHSHADAVLAAAARVEQDLSLVTTTTTTTTTAPPPSLPLSKEDGTKRHGKGQR